MNIAIVGAFFLGMVLVGIYSLRKITGPLSYFVADRSGSTASVAASLLATIIGGSSTVGLAGLGYARGLVGAWWMLVGVIGLGALSLSLAGQVRRYDVYTLPEILERQYGGMSLKIVASALIACAWLGIIAAQFIAAGKILSALWPGHFDLLIIIAAAVCITYTVLGGQYAILRTDLIQSVFILAGIAIAVVAGLWTAGGMTGLEAQLPPSHFAFPTSPAFSPMDLLTFLFFVGTTFLVGPDIYSRIFCAKNPPTARKALALTAAIMIPLAFSITLIGMAARVILPGIPPETALPSLVMTCLPIGLNGLVMAALLAAVMSSADTCILTTSTILSADVIQPLTGSSMTDRRLLATSRIVALIAGFGALFIALKIRGIIASLLLGYTIYSGGLIIPVLLGFYRKRLRLTAWGAAISIMAGGGLGLFLKLSGYDTLMLITIPVSAVLLFAGSWCERRVRGL